MWKLCKDELPDVEPNTDGKPCIVIGESGNVYRARWVHEQHEDDVNSKYWSEFNFSRTGVENEHYEINEPIIKWTYCP